MSITYSYIVNRASEACGLKDFNSESMEADDFRKVFLALQDSIRSMNADPELIFGIQTVSKQVAGSVLTFKPYTVAEQATIDGGGTVDITDRIVDVRPTVAPAVYINGSRLTTVDPMDLPGYTSKYVCAWSPDWDQDQVQFADTVGETVKIQYRKPIEVPTLPNDTVKVPERFHEYLILLLAVDIAIKLGLNESLAALNSSLQKEAHRVTANNNYSRPSLMTVDMNRFRR